jgi:hypothetical protein
MSFLVVLFAGCEDEDKIRIPESQTGANLRIVVDPAHRQINYQSVATDKFAFNAYSENKDINKVEITAQYKDQIKLVKTYSQADFSSGSASFEMNANDYATLFGVPGFADGSRGGNFTFSPKVTLNDGRVYPSYVYVSPQDSFLNVATSIIGSNATGAFTLSVVTSITCPPTDISGTYRVISAIGTSTDGCCVGETTVSGNLVTITADNPTTFSVSDITGGLYFEWYDVYGITAPEDSPGKFNYNCSEVNITNTTEPFGTGVQGSGDYVAASGRITYTWFNGFADQGTVILEKQ